MGTAACDSAVAKARSKAVAITISLSEEEMVVWCSTLIFSLTSDDDFRALFPSPFICRGDAKKTSKCQWLLLSSSCFFQRLYKRVLVMKAWSYALGECEFLQRNINNSQEKNIMTG